MCALASLFFLWVDFILIPDDVRLGLPTVIVVLLLSFKPEVFFLGTVEVENSKHYFLLKCNILEYCRTPVLTERNKGVPFRKSAPISKINVEI